jgi:hypothetical protein
VAGCVSGCSSTRPSASAVASAKEAQARSSSAIPPVHYALEVESPESGHTASIPWIEIRGRAGTTELFETDMVIALDTSLSTLSPSGVDLDEDGTIGVISGGGSGSRLAPSAVRSGVHPRNWTTDRDDTIAQLQLAAARRLIDGLGPRRNRIGLLTYTQGARVRAEVGAPAEARAALDEIRSTGDSNRTNVSAALRRAQALLSRPESWAGERQRAVLLFTDGRPTHPQNEYLGRRLALYQASRLAERGIDLYIFAFGSVAQSEARFLLELVESSGGRLYRVVNPSRLLEDLPPVELAPRWLEIENATTGARGQAIRTSADGRFDAYVPLEPGDNRIRVIAELGDGQLRRWEEDVVYQPPPEAGEQERIAEERVLRELEKRRAQSDAVSAPGL